MLTKYKDVLYPETGVNKPFQNASCQGRIKNFFQGEGTKFRHFFKRSFFPAELISSNLSNKNDSRGVRGHAPQKIFEYLHTVMVILALFEQFSGTVFRQQFSGTHVLSATWPSRTTRSDRSYVTGLIRGWSQSHVTYLMGGC